MHPADHYAQGVLSGEIVACRWVKLACRRHLDDLENGEARGIYFDPDAADHALEFFSMLKLWKGREYKGKEFALAPHFQFIVSSIFGWKRTDTGLRRFSAAYIEMARKGAKSTFAGGVGAYMLIADGEPGAEIYTAATKRDQALIVWENIQNLIKKSPFAKLVQFYKNHMTVEETWSKCVPLSSDSKSLDGLDSHFASLDELHAHPTPAVHDLIDDSVGARSQPLILIITTAGFDQAGVCYQRREYLTKVLKGIVHDDTLFGMIFTLDVKKDWPELQTRAEHEKDPTGVLEDDWTDEDVWQKAAPGLIGISQSGKRYGVDEAGEPIPGYMTKIEDIRKKAQYALEIPAAQNNFLTKRLNIWTQQASRWLSLELWDANNTGAVDEDDLAGRECVGGLDLAVVSDLLCWVMAFPDINDPERLDILMRCWCPAARLHDTRNKYRDIYQAWERQGLLKTSEGDAVDYEFVRDQIKQDARKFKITAISVDRLFQGYEFSQKLDADLGGTEKKPKVIACGMGYLSMAAPCNELERLLLIKKLNHGGNPILRFMADSVAVSMDPAGNKKPNKDKSQGKIDGIIGILLCLDRLLRAPVKKSVYEERGIITL